MSRSVRAMRSALSAGEGRGGSSRQALASLDTPGRNDPTTGPRSDGAREPRTGPDTTISARAPRHPQELPRSRTDSSATKLFPYGDATRASPTSAVRP